MHNKNDHKNRIHIYRRLAVGCMSLALAWPLSGAYAAISPVVKARVVRDFGRVSFEWPQEVRLNASTQGNQLHIRFEQAASVDSGPILRALSPYVKSVQQGSDGRSLILNLDQSYKVRSFVSGNTNGVDIVGLDKKAAASPAPAEEKPAAAPSPAPKKVDAATAKPAKPVPVAEAATPAAKPAPATPPADQVLRLPEKKAALLTTKDPVEAAPAPTPAKPAAEPKAKAEVQPEVKKEPAARPLAATPKAKPAALAAAKPAEKTVEKPAEKAAEKAAEKPAETAAPAKTEEKPVEAAKATDPAPQKVAEQKPSEAEASTAEDEQEAAEETAAAAPAQAPTKEEPAATPRKPVNTKAVTVEKEADGYRLIFPWTERVATAAFERGGRQFILFTKPLSVDLAPLLNAKDLHASVTKLGANASLVTLESPYAGLEAQQEKDDYNWTFKLTQDSPLPIRPIKTSAKTQPPLKPHLFMPVLQTADVVPFNDPLIGDKLEIVPLYQAGEGVFKQRDFVDFSLLPTAQGIVVKPLSDALRVARLRNGLKITAPEGLMISADLPAMSMPDAQSIIGNGEGTLYPYDNWRTPDGEKPFDFYNQLSRNAADSTKDEKQLARIRLAQWHMSESHPYEAIGLLNLVQREDPFLFDKYRLYAYRGAANYMAERYGEAEQDFNHESLKDIEELNLWRDSLKVFFTGDGKTDYLAYYDNFISKYPPSFRQQLALLTADHLINRKQYNSALKVFDTLNRSDSIGPIKDHADYLIAKVSAETRQYEMAKKIWTRLSELPDDQFVEVRARYALATLMLEKNEITMQEAIDRLDPLRIAWRGDQFEINLLTLLGHLYETTKQPREALRVYREMLAYFPQRQENLEIAAHMAEIFADLFNEGGADTMQPVDALALYYEFRDLTPVGEEGDRMVRNLASRLVGVDLLDRAAALLDHQVRFRTSGEERSRLGAQLALIHLLNRQPQEALQVMELTGYGQNPERLQETRALLTARALTDLGEPERALALLDGNLTHDAELLKLRIYWETKKWRDVITTSESLMGQRPDPSQPVTQEEGETLIKLAIAYIFEQETEQVQYLRDYFMPLMEKNPNRDLFAFITQDAPVDYRNMTELARQMNNVESFLANYKNRVKENGLDSMVQ